MVLHIRSLFPIFYIFLAYSLFVLFGTKSMHLENSNPQNPRTQKSDFCVLLGQF